MNKVCVIGVGPGDDAFIAPAARQKVAECDLILGSERLTRLFDKPSQPLQLRGNPPQSIQFILANRDRARIGVLVSGDPGLYSFMGTLSRFLGRDDYEVVPGISAVQLAFARAKETWENAFILSLHGRARDDLDAVVKRHAKLAVLTDDRWSPGALARYLLERGLKDREFIVCQDLSYPGERIWRGDVRSAAAEVFGEGALSVVLVIDRKR
ncbi:MAG: precorrin-6y C5,15-methyltransferase (decarboxylating) subunit CbiE, partial [Chloroflexi bacterium]|nr:precorrin-6y C5,15-methyltransferase (decarboxylating) subunit CbiE [Chloroflexota bacterium]